MRQPQPFGRYVLLERISVGGMAEVFKAKPVEGPNGQILAVKRILPSMAEDQDFIQMFVDEAKIAGQLDHPNVTRIYELGKHDDAHFIVMEFIWGKDLLQMQNRFRRIKQTMKPAMAAHIAARICDGLDYAHKKVGPDGHVLGIIHRDVSPQNILVSYDGDVKVIDFGIAKAASRATRTQAGVLKGKFGYMSPEQVRGLPLDRRSDIFAIGTILYELLTAERLFLGESDFTTLEKVRNVDITKPSVACPACPPELERIIMKALARDVDDRYQWGSEMAHDLDNLLAEIAPTFSSADLAAWMHEHFAPEIAREAPVLEEQRHADGKALAAMAGPERHVASRSSVVASVLANLEARAAGKAPPPAAKEPSGLMELDDADMQELDDEAPSGEATQITGADDIAALQALHGGDGQANVAAMGDAPRAMPEESTRILDEDDQPATPLANESTRILDENDGKPALANESTRILDEHVPAPPAATGMSGQSTVILQAPSAEAVARAQAANAPALSGQATMMLPAPVLPLGGAPMPSESTSQVRLAQVQGAPFAMEDRSQVAVHPPTDFVQPLPRRPPQKSRLLRDLLLVILLAGVLAGGGIGVHEYLTRSKPSGTVVVTLGGPGVANVFIDGAPRGPVDSARAVTLRDVPLGTHQVEVRGDGGARFAQSVTVGNGDVTVVNAALASNAPAKLRLRVKTAGASVWFDGAQLDEGTWRQEIPVKPGTSHEVRVAAPGHEELKLTLDLKAGETHTEVIELAEAKGHLAITTDPPGAEVTLDGKPVAGETPVSLDDLGLDDVKVVVKKHGFQTETKLIGFKDGNHQQLELKLRPVGATVAEGDSSGPRPLGARPVVDEDDPPIPVHDKAVSRPKELAATPVASEPVPVVATAGGDGFLVANTQPFARVVIDGKDTGRSTPIAPRAKIPLAPGKHTVTFVAGGNAYNYDIVVKPGEDVRLVRQLGDAP